MNPEEITYTRSEALDLLVVLDAVAERLEESGTLYMSLLMDVEFLRNDLALRIFPDLPYTDD
ncbi:MAG: hypothetical protein AB7H43_14080 [Acidimicrobiia bacterium]